MLIMKRPDAIVNNLPANTTGYLIDVYSKDSFAMMKRYLINDKVFAHPGKVNKETLQFDKLDLDYQLIRKDEKMYIVKSDRPNIDPTLQPSERFRNLLQGNAYEKMKRQRFGNIHAKTGTSFSELNDNYLDSLDRAGYERIILSGNMIDHVLMRYMTQERQAVIIFHAYGFNIIANRNSQVELYREFCQRYEDYMNYLLYEDENTVRQFLYRSIKKLIKQIIWFQG